MNVAQLEVPILLTSSVIAHDTGVALTNPELRTQLAIDSVREWLRVAPDSRLVLCDGSGFNFSPLVRQEFPTAEIECIAFTNSVVDVQRHGRGYGEGEIVRYALSHSKFINDAQCFAKCTSKLWVENYTACMQQWNGRMLLQAVFKNVFSLTKPLTLGYIDTRFYVMSIPVYNQYFLEAHKHIRKDDGYGLEDCFRDIVREQCFIGHLSKVAPVIEGVGGGIGKAYRNPMHRRIKERFRLWLIKRKKNYAELFLS